VFRFTLPLTGPPMLPIPEEIVEEVKSEKVKGG